MTKALAKPRFWMVLSLLLWVCATAGLAQNVPSFAQDNAVAAQGFRIAGTVVDAVTGAMLSRVRVSIANTRARAERIETVTDESGHFEFAGVPPGKYSLQGARRG